ncbi:MAG: ATP synthase F0 subunit A [Chitinophagia bacterium]|nr:ATP synthase F0 subunit A [Chitinophagia bacterium]
MQNNKAIASTQDSVVEPASAHTEGESKPINITELVFGHIADAHEWHLFEMNGKPVAMPLPIIIYNKTKGGLEVFSSAHFEYEEHLRRGDLQVSVSHEGYHLEKGMKEKVVAEDGSEIYDLSITKNVLSMLISVVLLLVLMLNAAKKYKTMGAGKAPSGFQNALESAIIFIRDEVAKPNLGKKHNSFMPLLLTIFFFVWINNLLGLLPGGANFTGNIAVTLCLATISFIVMVVRANGHFWGHLLNPPDVPFAIKLLLVPIEIISLFIKPIALTIRLFANILAGHIVILSVILMIFIFGNMNKAAGIGFVPVSIAFSIFMFVLELLVAAIQAFIFTNLTAVFIGSAIEEPHHHAEHAHH